MSESQEIKTTVCPVCDSPPLFTFMVPYFCTDTSCQVVSYDPYQTQDWLLMNMKFMESDLPT